MLSAPSKKRNNLAWITSYLASPIDLGSFDNRSCRGGRHRGRCRNCIDKRQQTF